MTVSADELKAPPKFGSWEDAEKLRKWSFRQDAAAAAGMAGAGADDRLSMRRSQTARAGNRIAGEGGAVTKLPLRLVAC